MKWVIMSRLYLQISHRFPLLFGGQTHENAPMPSMHVDPSVHGCDAQSFMLIRQSGPSKPFEQTQRNQSSPDSHVPLLWHGPDEHKSVGSSWQLYEGQSFIIVSHNVPAKSSGHLQ
jgi:hypothetical protein